MAVDTDPRKIDELLSRGVAEVIKRDDLDAKLRGGTQLRIKLGIDPTSPNLHIGRSIPILKLRDFQELGHQIVFIVGDFTAVIGDTSDKDAERPMLEREVIEKNKESYYAQAGKIIDLSKVELHYNSEWLEPLTYRQIGEHADLFSVADFTARENIKKRLDLGTRVSLREMLYPLMQGYDSVAIRADVELGGTDQKFNVLAGRPLQEHFGQAPQNVILNPLIMGLDGRKMSSSWGNVINLTDEPNDMYGKVMSLTDNLVEEYLMLTTRVPLSEISEILALHPKEAKMRLARELVTLYHNQQAAERAEASFTATFSEGSIPEDIPHIAIAGPAAIIDILVSSGMAVSKSEARRLLEGGGVVNAADDLPLTVESMVTGETTLRVGKRRFLKIITAK